MNRRTLILNGMAAMGGAALVPFVYASPRLPPAIQANIDYWTKACPEWLAECPPWHTSYYLVKEGERFRVYGVTWNGSNLNDHRLFIPENEDELIFQARDAIHPGMGIGDQFDYGRGEKAFMCSYVYDSPLRRIKKWGGSMSTWLLANNYLNNGFRK